MGGILSDDGGYATTRAFQREMIEQDKKLKEAQKKSKQASADRLYRDVRYNSGNSNAIADNLLAIADYLSTANKGDTTLSQESLLNLGGKLG